MKGTAARGHTTGVDREQARQLQSSAKERAENLKIVDLLRNDLARVAPVGSMDVPQSSPSRATVWQLTSEITAPPRTEVGLADVLRAPFPCGSVTGVPEQRTGRGPPRRGSVRRGHVGVTDRSGDRRAVRTRRWARTPSLSGRLHP
ncbi:chorismate binding enzyme [Blastococcus mobilis]|uniref:Chorismate binding enzyme n=1 Tax=Blastococcus mobilis TaxID=1938746 RepID=A0A239A5K8_9ACTN|nr:chorismate binding enzyme [Blastococcus mobilis]